MILESAEISDVACRESSDKVWRGTYSSEAQTRHSLRFRSKGFSAFANAFPILLPARVNRKGIACSSSCGRLGVFMIIGDAEGLRAYIYLKNQLYSIRKVVEKSNKWLSGTNRAC